MGFKEKISNIFNVTDIEYPEDQEPYEDEEDDGLRAYDPEDYEQEEQPHQYSRFSARSNRERTEPRIVDIGSQAKCAPMVLKKLDKFDNGVCEIADIFNEKHVIVLNLETCPDDACRRILDFLYGVAYSNSGEIKRVAGRAYIISPKETPLTGEMLDELNETSTTMFQ